MRVCADYVEALLRVEGEKEGRLTAVAGMVFSAERVGKGLLEILTERDDVRRALIEDRDKAVYVFRALLLARRHSYEDPLKQFAFDEIEKIAAVAFLEAISSRSVEMRNKGPKLY